MGWTDEQEGGKYRIKKRGDQALFGYVVGPTSWKKFLHPPQKRLWQAKRENKGFTVLEEKYHPSKLAFIGIRSCELHAISIQDRVFLEGSFQDPYYDAQRKKTFTIAVNCGLAGGTCFCVSMETGPKATSGFDLSLTEVIEEKKHYFVVEIGSKEGEKILNKIPHEEATKTEINASEKVIEKTRQTMGRQLNTDGIKEILYKNTDHSRWDHVASRCLTCGNCTMVCPTCFCTNIEDITDLSGEISERWQRWDSCFTMDFSYVHGGTIRSSAKSRYRQWMTHKLATWMDQFGTSGCVGCGRCITWCPVGIDITEESQAIREQKK